MALTSTFTFTTIPTQAANVGFTVSGTYTLNETTWTSQLIYEDNNGNQMPIASPSVTLGVSSWSYTHAGLPAGTHTITVKDPLTGTVATSNSFLVTAGQTITVAVISGAVVNTPFTFTGTLTGYATAPGLQYQLSGPQVGASSPKTSGAVTGVTTTGWSMPFTITAAGTYSFTVTDGTIIASPVTFSVAAATVNHVITPSIPSSIPAGSTFTYSGTLSGYTAIPSLTYMLNNNATATVTGVTLTGWSMSIVAPTTTGASTLTTSDGSQKVVSNFTVTAANKIISPTTPNGVVAGQSFTFQGVLSGYTTIPALSYTILPGGASVPMTGVSTTGWAMTVTVATAGSFSVTVTDGTVTSQAVAFTVATATPPTIVRAFQNSPGMDGSFWVGPFQNSANWISSSTDARIVALRGGTPSINTTGNFAPPWYMGGPNDPQVTVTDGTHSIVVRIPLGAVIETPNSATDNSIGGADSTQPYLVWSISGASMKNASGQTISAVQATGTVITGTYGFAVQDGAGLMMVDAVTGAPGDNNSFGCIQSYELAQLTASSTYVIQHMLAFQLDVSFQASSAGPIWPLLITDTSSGGSSTPYAGPIPQGVTIGIPANVARPVGQTRGFYGLWDCFQQFGGFNYNFGEVGGVNLQLFDATGQNTAMVNQLVAAWPTVAQSLCILNYANGVSGAQYSLATTKGAIAGSTNAFPAPPPLDLSPTGGKNVAPSTFGAWYPSGYNVTPTNSTTGAATFVISPNTPTNVVAGTPFSFTGSLSGYTTTPTLTYAINGAAPVALTGVTTTGWSALVTITTPGATTIVVTDAVNGVSGSTGFSATSTGTKSNPVTWNPNDLAGSITLSNGNYTATAGGSTTPYGSAQGVRTTAALNPTQITAWEVTFTAITQNASVGVADTTHVLNTTGGMGSDIDSIGAYPSTGTGSQPAQTVYDNENQLTAGNGVASVAGAVITCVCNGANFYFSDAAMRSTSGVQWNNSATADPVKNVGGLSFTGISSPYYPAFECGEGGSIAVLNDGTAAFSSFLSAYIAANPSVVSLSGQTSTVVAKAITPNVPAGVVVGAAFTFTGALTGYTSAPTLTYALNGAAPVALSGVTVSGWSSTLVSQATGSNTIIVSDGTVSNQVSFTVAATGGGTVGNKVAAPLTGTVTKGTWTVGQRQSLANSPSGLGYMQYNVLPPAQASANFIYPVLFVNHPNDDGMNGSSYPKDGSSFVTGTAYGSNFSLDTMYNTVAFRTAHPCYVVCCQIDQTLDLTGANANANGGGYNDSQNSGWNENAVNAVFASVVSAFPIDKTQRYYIGYSLGGISTLAQLVDNNVYNGPGIKQWTAGATFSDQLFRPNTANSTVFSRMASVPLACFSTDSDNVPSSYDQPAWQSYAGNSTYPAKTDYDKGMSNIRAGTSNFYYVNYGQNNPATTFMPMNADGGDGTILYAWLFSQTSGSTGPTITGVAFTPATPITANSPVNTVAGSLLAASSNGALTSISFTLNTTTNFKISGSNIVFNNAAVAAGAYPLSVTVTAANATNSPQSYPVTVTVAGAGGGTGIFRVSKGQILNPAGTAVAPVGINLDDEQLTSTNANVTSLQTNFPGIGILRVAFHSYPTAASFKTQFAALTAAGIILVVEDHTSIGQQPYTATSTPTLAAQLAFYTDFATTYKTNPYVWFDTQNEAYPLTSNNGDDVTQSHVAIYNAIRNAGNTSPILLCEQGGGNPNELPGGSGPQLTAKSYATLTNVIWDYHFYNWTTGYSGVQATIQSDFNGFIAQCQQIQSGDGVVPVIVGEYGPSTNGDTPDDTGGSLLVDIVGKSGLGSMAWAWNAGGSSDILTGGTVGVGGGALTTYGKQVATNIKAATTVVTPPTGTETADKTQVTTAGVNIVASSTPGTAGNQNTVSFTAAGTIMVNGVVTGGANVISLYYLNHTVYQENSDGNWYAPITAGTGNTGSAVASPLPGFAPAPAALNGLGYTVAFADDFTVDNMCPNITSTTGYNWYQGTVNNGGKQVSPTNYNVMTTATASSISNGNTSGGKFPSTAGGILQINGIAGMTYNANWVTVAQQDSALTGPGRWNHGYFEAYVQFKNGGASTTGGWPAWWSWSNPGPSGNAVEIDIMEYDAQNQPNGFMAWTVSDPGGDVKVVSPNQPATQIAITDSQWHVYAVWWRGNGTTGTLDFYYDGAHIGPQMTTGVNGQVPDLESNGNLYVTIGCGPGWPQYMDWVRVWRLPGT